MQEGYNKLESKIPRAKRFLWWIEKANQQASLVRPPCYRFWWEKGWHDRFKSIMKHFIFCRKYPWTILPHKPGERIKDPVLEPYFGEEALLKVYEETFGQPYGQPIVQQK